MFGGFFKSCLGRSAPRALYSYYLNLIGSLPSMVMIHCWKGLISICTLWAADVVAQNIYEASSSLVCRIAPCWKQQSPKHFWNNWFIPSFVERSLHPHDSLASTRFTVIARSSCWCESVRTSQTNLADLSRGALNLSFFYFKSCLWAGGDTQSCPQCVHHSQVLSKSRYRHHGRLYKLNGWPHLLRGMI